MPLYDYECPDCETKFEEFRSLKERASAQCPKCGKAAKKLLSSFFFPRSTPTPGRGCPPSGGGG